VNEEALTQFNLPSGQTTLNGYVRLSQTLTRNQNEQTTTTAQHEWYRIDVEGIAGQLPYEVYPFYVLQLPPQVPQEALPYRRSIDIDLSDGPHLGYAGQWFIFASILGFGYLYYLYKILKDEQITSKS
jgi:surfeit locus 1 family protein